jgi:glycosyltransferase involved in cell wall biosynthesis
MGLFTPVEAGAEVQRVDMLHPCYWPEVRRGSERFIHDLGLRLAKRGHRPRLITSHPGSSSVSMEDGIEIVRNHRPKGRRLQVGLRSEFVTHLPASMRALRKGDAHLVHALYPTDGYAASRWGRRGRPVVFSLMGMPRPETLKRRLWRRVVAGALARADVSVCLSERAAELTQDLFGLSTRVINPGVDLAAFRPTSSRAPVPTILCPADLSDPRKGGPLLREAFSFLRINHPDARLVLSRPPDSTLIPAEPGVEFANLDNREDLVRAYSEAWITVLLSSAEAFGLVLIESLACGTPVLALRGSAADEIVDSDGVGRLLDEADPEAAAGMIAAAMDPSEEHRAVRISRAGAFSAERCATAYEELYSELI